MEGKGRTINQEVVISKCLSRLLRHSANQEGLKISSGGYIAVSEILSHKTLSQKHCTLNDIKKIVETNDKKRFTLRKNPTTGILEICANQGHTLDVPELNLKPILSTNDINGNGIVHGTYKSAWPHIKSEGLHRMKRNHIHFAQLKPGEYRVVHPLRKNCQILLFVDIEKAIADGIPFFLSANEVVLSPGNAKGFIETKYFFKVVDVLSGNDILI